jgi:hypothetical protein
MAKEQDYLSEIQTLLKRWNHIYKYGSGEPRPDGFALNQIRSQISYYQYLLKVQVMEGVLDDVSLPALPPEVSNRYMSRYEERMRNVELFRKVIQKSSVYKDFKKFIKNFKATSTKKAAGVHIPAVYRSLLRLEFKSEDEDIVLHNTMCLIREFGDADAVKRFMKRYNAEKDDIKAMTTILEELRASENKKDAPKYDMILPRGLGVQMALF